MSRWTTFPLVALLVAFSAQGVCSEQLEPLEYQQPGLHVDLGAGLWAWPLPMDFDNDGDLDIVIVCPDKPYNGTYVYENPGVSDPKTGDAKFPIFKPARRISRGLHNVSVSYVDGQPRVLSPGHAHPLFREHGLDKPTRLPLPENIHPNKVRANQWKYVDFDGDEHLDLIVGVEDWTDYGWDDAFDEHGKWKNGPLHGYVYWLRNTGSNDAPAYDEPAKIEADGKPIDGFGMPSPNFADFDADGDLDLVCGEFLDGFTYYQNHGTRTQPRYRAGRRVMCGIVPLKMDLQMIVPVAIDWDKDGDVDLVVGDEDGRVALIEHTGNVVDEMPQWLPPRYFRQEADALKCGALSTPVACDWDADGDQDIICGNTAGYLALFENLSGPGVEKPQWAALRHLSAGGKIIRIQAGPNGSIQGPCEAKWGYTSPTVADWDHDGKPDIVINSIWGKIEWYRNTGTRSQPELAAAQPIEVAWTDTAPKPAWNWWNPTGNELVTQWRTTPVVVDFNRDGLNDLVMLDHEGFLAFYERRREKNQLDLLPGRRIFVDTEGQPLHLNAGRAGKSGRRKLRVVDWDGDTKLDVIINSDNAQWLRQTDRRTGLVYFEDCGNLDERNISGHSTSPTDADFDGNHVPDLLVGAEDGRLYYKRNPRAAESPILVNEFIYARAPFPECHASTIVETPSGLVAAWFGGTEEKDPDVSIWLSRHKNGKWNTPVEVADGVQSAELRYPTWNPVLFRPSKGPLLLFYKVGPDPMRWWGELRTSTDDGLTWSPARRLPEGILGPVKNKPIELSDGTILSPSSSEHAGWRVHFERSTDGGKTWELIGPVNDGKQFSAIQPSILRHADGQLQALGRSRQGCVFQIWSKDNGQTWGEMTATDLPNPSSGTDAVTLSDGRHLLIYNHTRRGRSPLNVAISQDGRQWDAALVLENEPGEYSYPAVIQTTDGLVHFTYTWKRQRVKHVVIDPKRLKSQPITEARAERSEPKPQAPATLLVRTRGPQHRTQPLLVRRTTR